MKNKSYKWIWLIGGIVLAANLVLYCCFGPVNRIFFHLFTDCCDSPEEGLGSDVTSTYYINGVRALVLADTEDPEADIKQVFYERAFTRLVNFTEGYRLDFPADAEFDFSKSESVVEAYGDGYKFTVSMEHNPYPFPDKVMGEELDVLAPDFSYKTGLDQYIGYYQSRFLLTEKWQKNNRVQTSSPEIIDAAGYKAYRFDSEILEMKDKSRYPCYSYLYICVENQRFLRVMVKYEKDHPLFPAFMETLAESFARVDQRGVLHNRTDFAPELPENWSAVTRRVYDNIVNGDLRWGIYTTDVKGAGIRETIPNLEEKLDYNFPVVLGYVHSIEEFPMEFMNTNWENGRLVELTYQLTENNNEDMFGYSPALDLYREGNDESVREFARKAKEFGHPFLFRPCNEMNSDWTSYGGVVNMADPDIFIENWRTIYRIFEEEGVRNCIWVYNPNDRNAPPNRWNDSINYYPGDEYCQMIGVTGYNNGTYYTEWGEEWREFDVIYDHIESIYSSTYGAFPWIITEFSSSSVGGDKVKWIENMFDHIGKYKNIKMAIWFSSADWDAEGNVARPYWLDETPQTTEAFRKGLKNYSDQPIVKGAQ